MDNILVEILATTSCDGTCGTRPSVIKEFSVELGVKIKYVFYKIWEIDSLESLPDYICAHLTEIRNGNKTNLGFFINSEWFNLRWHNADDVIKIRKKLIDVADLQPDISSIKLYGRSMEDIRMESSTVDIIGFSNSVVSNEMGSFSTDFKNIWFFEGSIKKLSLDNCPVEQFTYKGYDINKLIEIAEKNPQLFPTEEIASDKIKKSHIDDIQVLLVSHEEAYTRFHPCKLCRYKRDNKSKMHKAIDDKFGGLGYKAVNLKKPHRLGGFYQCGWMGIAPKDILRKDIGYASHCEIPDELILCLTCYISGVHYGKQYNRIGIAKKMIKQAIADAKDKGYRRIEAYPHPEIIPALSKCGFSCVDLQKNDGEMQKYFYYDIV